MKSNILHRASSRGLLGACFLALVACGESRPIQYNYVSFSGEREKKAVSIPAYSGENKAEAQRFIDARSPMDQGLLKAEMAGKMTPEGEALIKKSRELYIALADDPSLDNVGKAAAQHGVAMTFVILRDYDSALEWMNKAAATDPLESAHGAEANAIKNGFYQKLSGYETREISGPTFTVKSAPVGTTGLVASVEVFPARVIITKTRTIVSSSGLIWINGKKSHNIHYQEFAKLQDTPIAARITLKNTTDHIASIKGALIQASANGTVLGSDISVKWQGDIDRIAPSGEVKGIFGFGTPALLPGSGEVVIKVVDIPSATDTAGIVTAKRTDEFTWTIGSITTNVDVLNFNKEEDVTEQEATDSLGKAVIVGKRHVALVEKIK